MILHGALCGGSGGPAINLSWCHALAAALCAAECFAHLVVDQANLLVMLLIFHGAHMVFMHLQRRGSVRLERLAHLVVDEADKLLDLGFEPELKRWVLLPLQQSMHTVLCR